MSARPEDFDGLLLAVLPWLHARALRLTRNRWAAEDLVHDAIADVLSAHRSFTPGTNFSAWAHAVLLNRFRQGCRRKTPVVAVGEQLDAAGAMSGGQDAHLMLREVLRVMSVLPRQHRRTFDKIVMEGRSYDEVSQVSGLSPGTVKSRVSRIRRKLLAAVA